MLDIPYAELESFTSLMPLEVTLLPSGAFSTYKLRQQQAGADLTRLKPPHINPSDTMIDALLNGARKPVLEAVPAKRTSN